jgi:hypothetical protein
MQKLGLLRLTQYDLILRLDPKACEPGSPVNFHLRTGFDGSQAIFAAAVFGAIPAVTIARLFRSQRSRKMQLILAKAIVGAVDENLMNHQIYFASRQFCPI